MWFLCTTPRHLAVVAVADVAAVDVDDFLAHRSLDGYIDVSATLLFELSLLADQIGSVVVVVVVAVAVVAGPFLGPHISFLSCLQRLED